MTKTLMKVIENVSSSVNYPEQVESDLREFSQIQSILHRFMQACTSFSKYEQVSISFRTWCSINHEPWTGSSKAIHNVWEIFNDKWGLWTSPAK